ncbi:UNVERIFIED_CONTAM: hypothetical protein K2H54_044058 [Gekko kuhli]
MKTVPRTHEEAYAEKTLVSVQEGSIQEEVDKKWCAGDGARHTNGTRETSPSEGLWLPPPAQEDDEPQEESFSIRSAVVSSPRVELAPCHLASEPIQDFDRADEPPSQWDYEHSKSTPWIRQSSGGDQVKAIMDKVIMEQLLTVLLVDCDTWALRQHLELLDALTQKLDDHWATEKKALNLSG